MTATTTTARPPSPTPTTITTSASASTEAPQVPPNTITTTIRKKRAHTKSRRGCGNCKIRRVKCDERRPECAKCASYGVSCNYDEPGVQLLFGGGGGSSGSSRSSNNSSSRNGGNEELARLKEKNGSGSSSINSGKERVERLLSSSSFHASSLSSVSSYQLKPRDMDLLHLFDTKTVYTLGTKRTARIYHGELVREALTHPWLLRVVLATALMHKRELQEKAAAVAAAAAAAAGAAGATGTESYNRRGLRIRASAEEECHWYQGTALFSRALAAQPIRDEDKDSLWATAVLLGASAFYRMDARTVHEAWPLDKSADGDTADLAWLAISDGKKVVWELADVKGRRDSVFHTTAEEYRTWPAGSAAAVDIDHQVVLLLPPEFRAAGLAAAPYWQVAVAVANLLREACDRNTLLRFLAFLGHVTPEFKTLLRQKDARALVVLAMWYAKLCEFEQWWIQQRARLEGLAICIYLETYYAHDEALMRLVEYPKMMCRV